MPWVIPMELLKSIGMRFIHCLDCKVDLFGNSGITVLNKHFLMAQSALLTVEILVKCAMTETLSAMEWFFLIAHQSLRCMNSKQLQRPLSSQQQSRQLAKSQSQIANSSKISAILAALGPSLEMVKSSIAEPSSFPRLHLKKVRKSKFLQSI